MNRRLFIQRLLTWSKVALVLGLCPSSLLRAVYVSQGKDPDKNPMKGHSLWEMAHKKWHHAKGRFKNPFSSAEYGDLWPIIRWKLFSKNRFKAMYSEERVTPVSIDWQPVRHGRNLSITFLKHASVLIKDMDTIFIVDPVFSSFTRFIKDFTPLAFDTKEIPRPHYVLITHGHYDHLDISTLSTLGKDTHLITPLGYHEILDRLGFARHTEMDWFDTFRLEKREIILLPCNHWTMRNPMMGPNRSLWGAFLIRTASGANIFISGDTGYFEGFREIGEMFSIDIAIMNLGAYEPRWFMASSHMNPFETVKAFKELRANRLIIVHWGTFRLGDEPVYLPPIQVREELERLGLLDRFSYLNHGETLFLKV